MKYQVTIDVGSIIREVEASSEEEANKLVEDSITMQDLASCEFWVVDSETEEVEE